MLVYQRVFLSQLFLESHEKIHGSSHHQTATVYG